MTIGSDYRAENIVYANQGSRFSVFYRDALLGEVSLSVPGLFNIYNSLAAIAIAVELDMPFPAIAEGLLRFVGVHRRLEVQGEIGGMTVIDDYGHHPTEIRATLAAVRQAWGGRIIVVFQPHRYTRTKALFEEFLTAFVDADLLLVLDIYAAGETAIPGISANLLCEEIKGRAQKNAVYLGDADAAVAYLSKNTGPGDVIVTLGAGSIWKVGKLFLAEAAAKAGKAR